MTDEQPRIVCPRCGIEEPDYDGLGMIAHLRPIYARGCGYCRHASVTDGTCDYCGDEERATE